MGNEIFPSPFKFSISIPVAGAGIPRPTCIPRCRPLIQSISNNLVINFKDDPS
ncbi:hypothetical protein Scep_008176 [Stephania cephalantha]|uniref:Uncharacterized protein n=1 Tax=Stephania cephalantha TaxID=152367 RepID=A0AAP0KD54_9MAGN